MTRNKFNIIVYVPEFECFNVRTRTGCNNNRGDVMNKSHYKIFIASFKCTYTKTFKLRYYKCFIANLQPYMATVVYSPH